MAGKKKDMRIIGLMSGTSHDGVDAALVEISSKSPSPGPSPSIIIKGGEGNMSIPSPLRGEGQGGGDLRELTNDITVSLLKHLHIRYPDTLRDDIRNAFNGNTELICRLNFILGEVFSEAVLSLLKKTGLKPEEIDAVASHGQTIYHIPPFRKRTGSTLQIGEASVIAERTGILTISDFRTADMAAGGHGAPLVPMADYLLFKKAGKVRAVLNIGGIANVTIVRENIDDTVAFDTGPGNSLIDEAMRIWSKGQLTYDFNGSFAETGKPISSLLSEQLSHPYFSKRPPKSTGRETFGRDLAEDIYYRNRKSEPQDIVSTLTHLTAITIYRAVIKHHPDEVIVTGGGVKNRLLMGLIYEGFKKEGIAVNEISLYDIPPQAKEAVSFAILGYRTLNKLHGNVPSATGAKHKVILGKITMPLLFLLLILISTYSYAGTPPSNLPAMDGMVLVKAGCFDMGDVIGDGDPDEKPVHKVCLDDFYIGKYEVTQKQWKAVMGKNPSLNHTCENCPVENVSYIDVQEFIRKLNLTTDGKYRLPTEAEWEYTARSGGKKEGWAGIESGLLKNPSPLRGEGQGGGEQWKNSGEKDLDPFAWFKNNAEIKTHPVGQKKPNGLGLYDMSGNVQEWVNDFHESEFYSTRPKKTAEKNPTGPDWSQYRVVRGGSILNSSWGIRNAVRYRFTADDKGREFGFRLAASVK